MHIQPIISKEVRHSDNMHSHTCAYNQRIRGTCNGEGTGGERETEGQGSTAVFLHTDNGWPLEICTSFGCIQHVQSLLYFGWLNIANQWHVWWTA